MNRKSLWLTAAFLLTSMIAMGIAIGWGDLRLSTVAALQTADLYIKDTPLDTGVEPNPDTGPMWVTEDIWVRTTPDPNYQPYPFPEGSPPWTPLPHENPEYRDPKFGLPNYVYVRVRNRGGMASSGTERLRLYSAKASTGLAWDTHWVDYLASNCGPTKLYGAEVTKPRRNAGSVTKPERDAYRDAILDIGTLPAFVFFGGVSYWHKQDEVHQFGPPNRHSTAAFLPWHREMINRYEVLLQESRPTVKLLYWDWTTDPENSTGGFNFFTPDFMGASGRGSASPVPIGLPFSALAPPAVARRLSSSVTPPAVSDATVLGNATYPAFRVSNEGSAHNGSHGYIGGGGNMSGFNTAAEDPFFFLLHANADRIWAQWQRDPSALARLDPATTYGAESANPNITTAMQPWDGVGTPIEPWTVAGGYIVSKTPQHASVVAPPIYDTAPLVIPVLNPGEAVVIQIPWYPPNPADFACFGGDQNHFCLLGRVETATAAPFGMTFPETSDVYANTRNNNNIAWKNITVVDNFPGALGFSSVLVRNVFPQPVPIGLRFADTRDGASFFNFGRIFVDLKPELFRRWIEGGAQGQGVRAVGGTAGQGLIEIISPAAFIRNIRLDPGEVFSVDARFVLFGQTPGPSLQDPASDQIQQAQQGGLAKWDLIQTGTPGNPDAFVGGQRFEVDFRKLRLVKAGSEWRYLDDGTNPGANWAAPGFDDSRWKRGRAELGFGDDPVTTINGGPADNRRITTFFRHAFEVADPGFIRSLLLRLKRDDGAVVYLNGTEVHRVNLPSGAVQPETPATTEVRGLEEEVFFPVPVSLALLRSGRNVIAVEVHQNSPRSEDLSFDLELCANLLVTRFRPDVAFAAPANGALFQTGQAIPIQVEAIDNDGQITSVSLFADGALVGSDSQPPYTFQLTGASRGSRRLRAVAVDNDMQQATADLTITVLDNTPPIVELTEPVNDTLFRVNDIIRASARASDPGGAVSRVEFFVRDALLFASRDRLAGAVFTPPYTLNLTGLAPGHYMLTAVAIDDRGAASQSMPVHFDVLDREPTPPGVCQTICFRSSRFHLLNPVSPPPGVGVEIGGANFNASTRNQTAIRLALQGGPTPLQQLNQQFVAAQLGLIRAGGNSSPSVHSALRSPLGCYGLDFSPIALDSGFSLRPGSTLGELFNQARLAIRGNRTADMLAIARLFKLLNGDDPLGRCGK